MRRRYRRYPRYSHLPSFFFGFFLLKQRWPGNKLEVESILCEACDCLFSDPAMSWEKAQLRVAVLQILGEARQRMGVIM